MAKNKRKKKLKEQDFQRVKLKVGKKLQPAQNATDTSFKSRAIFIPTQLNKDTEPTNQRNQTLKVTELSYLGKVKHENIVLEHVLEFVSNNDKCVKRNPQRLHVATVQ